MEKAKYIGKYVLFLLGCFGLGAATGAGINALATMLDID